MKIMFTLLCFNLAFFVGYSQNISGTWEGNFVEYSITPSSTRGTSIYLILEHKKESVTGHSITIFERKKIFDTVVCIIGGFVKSQNVTISETSLVNMKS